MVWTARNTPSTTCRDPGSASRERRRWLIVETCSRDSERKSSPYCESSMRGVRKCESAKVRRCERGRRGGARQVTFALSYSRTFALLLSEYALHRLQHARGLERLDHEVPRAGLDGLDHQRLLAHGAAHQDLGAGVFPDDLAHGVDPAHVGHHDVHRHQVGLELAVLLHRLHARLGLGHDLEAGLGEDVADHRAHEDRVVADQHGLTHQASVGRARGTRWARAYARMGSKIPSGSTATKISSSTSPTPRR